MGSSSKTPNATQKAFAPALDEADEFGDLGERGTAQSGVTEVRRSSAPSDRPTAHPSDLKGTLLPELRVLFAAADFETALPMAEALLAVDHDPEIEAIVEVCKTKLSEQYEHRLGRLGRVPLLRVRPAEWTTLDLEPRSAFVLMLVDGLSSLDMILDLSGMPRFETLRVLSDLLVRGVIEV